MKFKFVHQKFIRESACFPTINSEMRQTLDGSFPPSLLQPPGRIYNLVRLCFSTSKLCYALNAYIFPLKQMKKA